MTGFVTGVLDAENTLAAGARSDCDLAAPCRRTFVTTTTTFHGE